MRTQPVFAWSGITTAISVVLAVVVGWLFGFSSTEFLTAVSALGLGGPLVSGVVSRTQVTPLADPRDNEGNPLAPRL